MGNVIASVIHCKKNPVKKQNNSGSKSCQSFPVYRMFLYTEYLCLIYSVGYRNSLSTFRYRNKIKEKTSIQGGVWTRAVWVGVSVSNRLTTVTWNYLLNNVSYFLNKNVYLEFFCWSMQIYVCIDNESDFSP